VPPLPLRGSTTQTISSLSSRSALSNSHTSVLQLGRRLPSCEDSPHEPHTHLVRILSYPDFKPGGPQPGRHLSPCEDQRRGQSTPSARGQPYPTLRPEVLDPDAPCPLAKTSGIKHHTCALRREGSETINRRKASIGQSSMVSSTPTLTTKPVDGMARQQTAVYLYG